MSAKTARNKSVIKHATSTRPGRKGQATVGSKKLTPDPLTPEQLRPLHTFKRDLAEVFCKAKDAYGRLEEAKHDAAKLLLLDSANIEERAKYVGQLFESIVLAKDAALEAELELSTLMQLAKGDITLGAIGGAK